MAQAITFLVPGTPLPSGESPVAARGTARSAVRVGARRAGGEVMRLTARPGDDIVVVRIANGPALYLHPEHARDMMRAQVGGEPTTARGAADASDAEVIVPAQLSWRGLDAPAATRGGVLAGVGGALIDTLEIITGLSKEKAAGLVTSALAKKIDGQVDPGVYKLSADELPSLRDKGQKVAKIPPAANGAPILVLAHGTFVDTASTFGKLWSLHPARVRALFEHYGDRVYALDHPTVGESPLANALMLADALPKDARIHMVTHSRGGLVAEVLARVAGGQGLRPEDLARFKGGQYARHLADLGKLGKLAKQRQFHVERMVRVACPARGTLLASRRLDAYLSVLKWGLELASVPVLPELVDFLSEIARRRTNPEELPGLEAMMPGRPVADWLNSAAEPVPGDLRVVAGDIEGDSILSWLKTLLSDAFYWADNDLVVQTRSMYGGTIRQNGAASFVLDRGGKVTHFNYFANERTANAITNGLLQDQPSEFQPIGPLSWKGEDSSGTRAAFAAARSRSGNASARPAVFVLPGILGSHLKVDGKRVWLSMRFLNNLDQLKWNPDTADRVKPDGPIGMSYDDLIDYLADTHEVIPFSFDWRRPMQDEANRLAEAVEVALAARNLTQQPVRVVAHSMGGLVLRTMRLERPETWKRMLAHDDARVLMLGTPNGGSWAPMQVLSGDDTFGNMLSALGSLFDGYEARKTIAGMTGLIQLQANLLDASLGLGEVSGWQRLEEADLKPVRERVSQNTWWHNNALQVDAYRWGLPSAEALKNAVRLRKRLDEQRETLGADTAKILLVVGKAQTTPSGVEPTDAGVKYLNIRGDGDGRVTLENACLPGVRTWQVDVAHGDIADAKDAFAGYAELLTRGDTAKLDKLPDARSAARAAGAVVAIPTVVASRPSRALQRAEPPTSQREVFAVADARVSPMAAPSVAPVRISLVNGNLKFIRHPLLLGHYRSLKLTGTEAVMDRLVDGSMSRSLGAGLYPAAVGSHQVFVNMWRNPDDPFAMPRPAAVVVVGLGEEGTLRAADIITSVRQATLAYAQRMSESAAGAPTTFDLAATLIGTGGIGMQIGTAAQAIAQGVVQANERLVSPDPSRTSGWPVVANLQLVELYLDRATEAHHALNTLARTYPKRFDLAPEIKSGQGGLPRPVRSGYRGAGYDFITVKRSVSGKSDAVIEFTLDTQRARSEVRGQATQLRLVDELVRVGADDKNRNTQIGRTLFQLLVPLELGPFLSDASSLLLQLDSATAAYPWELLDTRSEDSASQDDPRPWAVRTRMLRKLQTADFRSNPADARSDAGVLVIGEPLCDPQKFPPLPGAAEEARAVAEVLGAEARLHLDALMVVNAAFEQSYKVVHIAGHGIYFRDGSGGVALSNDTVFGPREVRAMRTVPELAFINCCHLGRIEPGSTVKASALGDRRPLFAANVAEELIKNGVRCVVAAGWAVDDNPAKLFATRFYQALTRGSTFAEAVGVAREETHSSHPGSNTWAAYQCYGDPDWRYQRNADTGIAYAADDPGIVSAEDLALELKTLAVQSKYGAGNAERMRTRIEHLEALYGKRWGMQGLVAEGFGDACSEARDFDNAIRWYSQAVSAEDGGASLRASEQLGNLRARRGANASNKAQGRSEILAATRLLEQVYAVGQTSERASLLGSALKRRAVVEANAGRKQASRTAIAAMTSYYREAEKLALKNKADNPYYPAVNRMTAELVLNAGQANWAGFEPADIAMARQSLQKRVTDDADFWSVVGLTELRIYEALAQRGLAKALGGILKDLADLKARAGALRMWSSVRDQALFTLSPYIASNALPKPESKAASRLLATLEDYAAK